MTKPDWCPQHVWTSAMAASVLVFDKLLDDGRVAVISIEARDEAAIPIARAILAAEQRERGACAALATNFATTSNTRDVDLVMQEAAAADTAEGIATAIRNRGEHHD